MGQNGSDDVLQSVATGRLLAHGRPVLVMLSGGRDSTCLLDLAVRISGPGAVTSMHMNFGLRAESDADQLHCERLCEQLGVELAIRVPRPRGRGNVQAWARSERYRSALELAERIGADVAVGHTATDQVETILYRLASSPSRRALLGMRPREALPGPGARSLIRPLLDISRAETAAYCRARGLLWREDESNADEAFARSRVRRALVPALRSIHPAAEQNVLALAELLRGEAEVLDEIVAGVLAGESQVSLRRLRGLPLPLGRLLVQRLADEAAGEPAPGTGRRLEELLALPGQGRASLDLPHGVTATVDGGILRFKRRRRPSRVRAYT